MCVPLQLIIPAHGTTLGTPRLNGTVLFRDMLCDINSYCAVSGSGCNGDACIDMCTQPNTGHLDVEELEMFKVKVTPPSFRDAEWIRGSPESSTQHCLEGIVLVCNSIMSEVGWFGPGSTSREWPAHQFRKSHHHIPLGNRET